MAIVESQNLQYRERKITNHQKHFKKTELNILNFRYTQKMKKIEIEVLLYIPLVLGLNSKPLDSETGN